MTTVFVWNNNQITSKLASRVQYAPGAKEIVGHVCMDIEDRFSPFMDDSMWFGDNPSHVSWIPMEESDSEIRGEGGLAPNFMMDLLYERYAPDHVIRIPTPPPAHVYRMKRERERYTKCKDGRAQTYDFYRKNCSRIVSRVLRAGWNRGGGNIRYGQMVSGLWTPLMVKRLSLDLKGGAFLDAPPVLMEWETFVRELYRRKTVTLQTARVLFHFKRRANNRGSSGATPRFRFSGNPFSPARKKAARGEANFPPELLFYTELIGRGADEYHAKREFVTALGERFMDDPISKVREMADDHVEWSRGLR